MSGTQLFWCSRRQRGIVTGMLMGVLHGGWKIVSTGNASAYPDGDGVQVHQEAAFRAQ